MPAEDGDDFGHCLRLLQLANPGLFLDLQRLKVVEDCLELVSRKLAGAVLVHMDDLARRHVHARYRPDRPETVAGSNWLALRL